jgi:L-asparaginase
MVPYSVTGSDALFNLGTAVMAVQLVGRGVFLCMNGRCFRWDRVKKNRETGIFEPIG